MDAHVPEAAATLADVRRVDSWARSHATGLALEGDAFSRRRS
jgi:hypothetical protein